MQLKKFFFDFLLGFGLGSAVLIAVMYGVARQARSVNYIATGATGGERGVAVERAKSPAERAAEAYEKSSKIKALYMTADVANDLSVGAVRLRQNIIELAQTTEINGIVIDVKEVCGPDYNAETLKELLANLHRNHLWAIGRIVVFKDASKIASNPEWYLARSSAKSVGDECARKRHLRAPAQPNAEPSHLLWQDQRGGYWLDPASPGARQYLVEFAKKMIDLGFDELQFDYVRFPSDGDVANARYPAWDGKTPKYAVMKDFFSSLHDTLKLYKPEIILSADLFGYVALRAGDVGIGQRLDDIGESFDYISLMVYPSHYYSGLYLPANPKRGLPAVAFDVAHARANPGTVVERSLLLARDFLDGIAQGTSLPAAGDMVSGSDHATTTPHAVRLRPWLEDFFHEEDQRAGRPFGAQKVRLQIEAAERVEDHGWLIWNAANVYTADALHKK